jgi:hypothetical protein
MINSLSLPYVHAEPEQERQILAPSLSRCQVERTYNQPLPQPLLFGSLPLSLQRVGETLHRFLCTAI